jgi:hypothetical protein
MFYATDNGNTAQDVNMSLWDAGNQYILAARDILQNVVTLYGPDTGRGSQLVNSTDSLFIVRGHGCGSA